MMTLTSFRSLPLLAALLVASLAPVADAGDAAAPDPHAGHAMPMPTPDGPGRDASRPANTPSGQDLHAPASAASDHGGHDMPPLPSGTVDPVQAQGLDTEPTPHDAHSGQHESHGDDRFLWWRIDQLEAVDTAEGAAQRWRGNLSWGDSLDRVGLASEGERQDGRAQELDTQLFVSHAVAPFCNAVAAVRATNGAGASQHWAGVGLQGLAPYWFETSAMVYAGEGGQVALKLDIDYELLLTNRLILQPALELNAYGREDATRGQGAGLADSRAGLRLRYEITRQFAPYVGIEWTQAYGATRDLLAMAGERSHDSRAVAGLRFWY